MDALGNMAWRRSGHGGSDPQDVLFRHGYEPARGRLQTIESVNLGYLSQDFYPEETTRNYDRAGNVDWAVLSQRGDIGGGATGVVRDKRSRSYYGADQRLRYFQERDTRVSGLGSTLEGVWEEYRYDPLGRRVLVNTRTKDLCTVPNTFRCGAATTRMVWAGDQLLWEIRRSSESPNERVGPPEAYGTVSYSHAGGIDRPLVITKDGVSILPHQNWRGQFSSGTYADGTRSDCAPGVTTNCTPIAWPGYRTTAWHHDAKEPDIRTWWGGLVDGMRDASGQQYKRNRYYDPATGQFTQPDPIGIAGGLNTYGFAEGDPVSYDDPYGLCPPKDHILDDCSNAELVMLRTNSRLEPARPLLNGAAWAVLEGGYAMVGGWAARGVGFIGRTLFGGRAARGASVGRAAGVASEAHNAANGLRLSKQLASIAQMGEGGIVIAGGGSGTGFRNAGAYAARYGGEASDWAKKSSSVYRAADGAAFETHWVENLRTGARVDFKTKIVQ